MHWLSLALITGANFTGAELWGADFTGATLDGAIFEGADLSYARGLESIGGGVSAAVPEPATLWVALAAGIVLLWHRCRRPPCL